MKYRVWIVEMWNEHMGRWEPTVGCGFTREFARRELSDWKYRNPSDKFRLSEYWRKG